MQTILNRFAVQAGLVRMASTTSPDTLCQRHLEKQFKEGAQNKTGETHVSPAFCIGA